MHVELISAVLIGLGVRADIEKAREMGLAGENIKMNIGSTLIFPRPGYVECMVNVESDPGFDALRLKFTYLGGFTLTTEGELVDDDQVKISAACTAKLFPYIRELIADVTRRLPLTSPLVLNPAIGDEKVLLRQMSVSADTEPQEKKQ